MFLEIFREAWAALGRNPVRSLLTMTGISWGIVAVTLLLSYGSGFRNVLMYTFEVFGKGAVLLEQSCRHPPTHYFFRQSTKPRTNFHHVVSGFELEFFYHPRG